MENIILSICLFFMGGASLSIGSYCLSLRKRNKSMSYEKASQKGIQDSINTVLEIGGYLLIFISASTMVKIFELWHT